MHKLEFVLRRIGTSLFVLIGVSVITFLIARVVPSNPAALYIGPKARQADIDRVTKQLGLDQPLPVQYAVYMKELLHGDLGTSISTKRPITQELAGRIPATLELLFAGMFLAVLFGVPLGVLSARSQGKPLDITVRIIAIAGVSMPAFFLGLILQIVFFRNLHLLPLAGRVDADLRFSHPLTLITHFILLDSLLTGNWITFKDSVLPPDPARRHPGCLSDGTGRPYDPGCHAGDAGAGLHPHRACLWHQGPDHHLPVCTQECDQPDTDRDRSDLCLCAHRYLLSSRSSSTGLGWDCSRSVPC